MTAQIESIVALAGDQELGIPPRRQDLPRGLEENGEARALARRPGRADHGNLPVGRVAGPPAAAGTPGAISEIRSAGKAEALDQLVSQFRAGGDQSPEPAAAQLQPAFQDTEIVDRLEVRQPPGIGQRERHGGHRLVKHVQHAGMFEAGFQLQPAHR